MELINSRDLKGIEESGCPFMGVFLLRNVSRRTAKTGKPFLVVEVGDRFGNFTFNVFEENASFNMLQNSGLGAFLEISGTTESFNDRFSPRITGIRRMTPADIKGKQLEKQLYDGPKESKETLCRELDSQIARIKNDKLRQTVQRALADVGEIFWKNTAAVSMHHAYQYGLLEHTVHVTRAGIALLSHYPQINADLAIAGMILHDIGKSFEYEGDGVYKRTCLGNLQGHVVIGYRIVRKAAISIELDDELTLQLEHIVLCHQGMLEYGAAVLPSSPEGIFVALVDNLDARMGMVEKAIDNTSPKNEFSEKILGLESVRVYVKGRSSGTI
ncbi:MAG: HD domain-containing protein [Puniceicoccales bacterium]|jgi:3'-5' exoribonuclease|nr:HD domain-containing protein [Puniceicoccales bacterium]